MTLIENPSIHQDATYPALIDSEVPSSCASIQSKEMEQRSFHDVEKAIPLDKREANKSPTFDDKNQAQVSSGANPSEPPDGGFQAWLAVAGGFCTIFASFGWINCIGIFQNYYQDNQLKSYSSSTISWIPSTESFMLFFFGLVAGKMTDMIGPRWPILLGSFLHVFGLMMTSISSKYYQIFLAQSLCSAIGCSFLFFPTIAAVGTWFSAHRALAFGIMVSGSSIGGIVLPIMLNHLIPRIGFGWSMRIVAFIMLSLLIFGNLAVKSRLPPSKRRVKFQDFVQPFKEPAFALLVVGAFFVYLGGFLPFTFIIVQAEAEGMSSQLAGYLVPIVNAASTFGRIIPGHMGDKYGVFNVMIIFTLFAGVISLALWLPASGNAAIITFAALYGVASGTTLSILAALVAQISDVRDLGLRTGTMYAFSSVGVLVGSPIAGAIVAAQDGSFSGLKVFCGATLLVGAVFTTASRQAQVGKFAFRKKI
ncbi:hypothetical protein BLS_001601 [Venturia inaequalis]|uniref:Major facilitator superfamily (MFS) profile domain-containing protein n=1 Tax=Venturia inaequalis TaxID=5025 RepID=A0A8H3UHM4_VENIN|nr:hypothetical protein EG328_006804 [Venturia inaequalis]KAE9977143.1 hypothetical protein BLS_001601 [Venturia inaequalis]RDI79934.1 hypothetical protein Vi05172_g9951 [Venturia inaequalis]